MMLTMKTDHMNVRSKLSAGSVSETSMLQLVRADEDASSLEDKIHVCYRETVCVDE